MSSSTPSQIPGLYHLIPLQELRRTPGVSFDSVGLSDIGEVAAIDRVIHVRGAVSPGPVGYVPRPWYMHTHQVDNLIVLHGTRYVELYAPEHGCVEHFTVTPNRILHGREVLVEGGAILGWPVGVFHRITSCDKEGSASLNLAIHTSGFDPRTNFSIYDLEVASGQFRVIRSGHLDQPGP
jgi:hypothetical protein